LLSFLYFFLYLLLSLSFLYLSLPFFFLLFFLPSLTRVFQQLIIFWFSAGFIFCQL